MTIRLTIGDRLRLAKPHPCGGTWWVVTRTGMDVGLKCETCGHRVMVPRRRLERRIREHVPLLAAGEDNAG